MSNEAEKEIVSEVVESKPNRSVSLTGIVAGISILMSVSLLVLGGISYQRMNNAHRAWVADLSSIQNTLQQANLPHLRQTLDETLQNNRELEEEITAVQASVAKLSQTEENNQRAWVITEAGHYVKLANQHVQYDNNIPLAILLLKMADAEIQALNDPKLDDVRKALANDLARLQAAAVVDVTGIYMRLVALGAQSNTLILPNNKPSQVESSIQPDQANLSWWKKGLHNTWQALQKIVVVRYHEKGSLPLMMPDEQAFLYQNVHAMLLQAEWALLHGQAAIYQASLQQASQWIKTYFDMNSPVAQSVLAELTELQAINIHPVNPDVADSLKAFAAIKNDY